MNLTYALESIRFQSPDFFQELADAVRPWIGKSAVDISMGPLGNDLSDLVFKRFKMRIPFVGVDSDYSGGYAITYLTVPGEHGYKRTTRGFNAGVVTKLEIDFDKVTIKGDISPYRPTIQFESNTIADTKLTAEEHAAIILHEIGHGFYTFSLLGLTASTNYALRDIARGYTGATYEKRVVMIANTVRELKLDGIDPAELAQHENLGPVVLAVHSEQQQRHRSELGISTYDLTESEALADLFAARFGAGKHFITGMGKLIGNSDDNRRRLRNHVRSSMANRLVTTVFATTLAYVAGVKIPAAAGIALKVTFAGASVNVLAALTVAYMLFKAASTITYYVKRNAHITRYSTTYNDDFDRLRQIRQQMQLGMRLMKLTPEQEVNYLADLAEIDEVINQTINSGYTETLYIFLYPVLRRMKSQVDQQRTFEDLAYNRLHDSALALKHA